MARLAVVGLGAVGLATSIAFALEGHEVLAVDVDSDRVGRIRRGEPPLFEPGLKEGLQSALRSGRLTVKDTPRAVSRAEIVFLCVGTPSRPDGSMEDAYVKRAVEEISQACHDDSRRILVVKSTVVPGTTEGIVRPVIEASGASFGLAVNPEFLREGHAMEDALHPDRIVLGLDGPETAKHLGSLYAHLTCPKVETTLRVAEAIKYATNAFLATKITLANELANLCQALGVSYDEVIRAVTLDPRINPRFLVPGVGFGGSCFPKDVSALVATGRGKGYVPILLEAVLAHNERQYQRAIALLEDELGDLRGKRVAILGLAFKGGTDDVRESRAIPLARALLSKGAIVVGYDPVAQANFSKVVPELISAGNKEEALRNADGCLVQADWPEFSQMRGKDFLTAMRTPVVVDCHRILESEKMEGIRFRRIG